MNTHQLAHLTIFMRISEVRYCTCCSTPTCMGICANVHYLQCQSVRSWLTSLLLLPMPFGHPLMANADPHHTKAVHFFSSSHSPHGLPIDYYHHTSHCCAHQCRSAFMCVGVAICAKKADAWTTSWESSHAAVSQSLSSPLSLKSTERREHLRFLKHIIFILVETPTSAYLLFPCVAVIQILWKCDSLWCMWCDDFCSLHTKPRIQYIFVYLSRGLINLTQLNFPWTFAWRLCVDILHISLK